MSYKPTAEEIAAYPKAYHSDLLVKFKKLTPAQHRLMAFNCASTAHSAPRTGEALLALGLVDKIERRVGQVKIIDYEVPVPIHMTYCQWCEEQQSGINPKS